MTITGYVGIGATAANTAKLIVRGTANCIHIGDIATESYSSLLYLEGNTIIPIIKLKKTGVGASAAYMMVDTEYMTVGVSGGNLIKFILGIDSANATTTGTSVVQINFAGLAVNQLGCTTGVSAMDFQSYDPDTNIAPYNAVAYINAVYNHVYYNTAFNRTHLVVGGSWGDAAPSNIMKYRFSTLRTPAGTGACKLVISGLLSSSATPLPQNGIMPTTGETTFITCDGTNNNVGIATTSPTATLDVNGSFKCVSSTIVPVLIVGPTPVASGASFQINNIPSGYRNLKIRLSGRVLNATWNNVSMGIGPSTNVINTANEYATSNMYGNGSGAMASGSSGKTTSFALVPFAIGGDANNIGYYDIDLFNCNNNGPVSLRAQSGSMCWYNGGSTVIQLMQGVFFNTAAFAVGCISFSVPSNEWLSCTYEVIGMP
jgi:hypothetical protein